MRECPACLRCFPDHVNHCPNDGDATVQSIAGEPILDGRYRLERRLGHGGMGVVFQARHIFLKTAHAIKVILPDLVGNDPMLVTRFRQEALAAAAIRHQNIIAVTDFGVVLGKMPFLVMEFVKGKSLHDILSVEGVLSPPRALEIMSPVCAGVAAAHRQNIVHRDLKPLNIMIQDELPINEAVKVLDFGLAKIKSGELLGSFVQAKTSGLMGSPFYMAPEQWSDEEPDVRADIYSLGVILYQMLGGDVPFKGTGIPSIMKKHLDEIPRPFSALGVSVPPQVEAVVRHALEKDADNRPQTVEAFITSLRDAVASSSAFADCTHPRPVLRSTSIPMTHPMTDPIGGGSLSGQSAAALEEKAGQEEAARRELGRREVEAARARLAREEETRRLAEEKRYRAEEEAARRKAEEAAVAARRAEEEERLRAEAAALKRLEEERNRAEREARERLEEEKCRRAEAERPRAARGIDSNVAAEEESARLRATQPVTAPGMTGTVTGSIVNLVKAIFGKNDGAAQRKRRDTEERARLAQEAEARRLAEEERKRLEAAARRSEEAARLRAEQQARQKVEEESARKRAEEERLRAEAEAAERKRVEEERQRAEAARRRAELEAQKLEDGTVEIDGYSTFHLKRECQLTAENKELASSKVILRHREFHYHGEEHIFEELIMHRTYKRLWGSLIHAKGGCSLLTGYGRYGGTSLVGCAVVKARTELQRLERTEAALLVLNFQIKDETKDSFKIEATKFGLSHLNNPQADDCNPDLEDLKVRAGYDQTASDPSLLEIPLEESIGATFFKPPSGATLIGTKGQTYDFSALLADLNGFFRGHRTTSELRHIVLRLINSQHLPSRVVFIIDRVRYLETLETLARSAFFSNKRIRVIALAREEDFDCWHNANQRLDAIKFSKCYVPCLWKITNSEMLFNINPQESAELQESFSIFLKHLEYKGKGSLGNIIDELRMPLNITYGEDHNYIDLEDLVKRADVQHSAWMQDMLEHNWQTILSNLFGGADQDENMDRARIGIYYLIDWIAHQSRFSKAELLRAADEAVITISGDTQTARETIDRLLFVLVENKYLSAERDGSYRVIWNKNNLPSWREVIYRRRRPPLNDQAKGTVLVAPTGTDSGPNIAPSASPMPHNPPVEHLPPDHTIITGPANITADSKKVFISYSHAEREWLQSLRIHLKPIERKGLIELWDDTRIKAGARWREEIKTAISSAKVAILLVGPNFLASDFIDKDELPPLLAASKANGMVILLLIVRPCVFMETTLSQFQSVNPPSNPLSAMKPNQRDELFVQVAEVIKKAINP